MNDNDYTKIVELVTKKVIDAIKKEGVLKTYVQRKNATVVSSLGTDESNIGKSVEVVLPYDTTSFSVRNETGKDLTRGNLVCIEYSVDLKNAIAVYKVN